MLQLYDDFTYLVDNSFDEKVDLRFSLSEKKKAIDSQLSELNIEIATMLTVAGADKVACDGLTVSMVEGRTTKKIDGIKLVELGVSVDTVKAATVESKGNPYVRVVKSKKETE